MDFGRINDIELDFYGYFKGCDLTADLVQPQGVIHCRLRRRFYQGDLVVEADLWAMATNGDLECRYTAFRDIVYMRPAGSTYHMIRHRNDGRDTDGWCRLEQLIAAHIQINE